MLDAPQLCAEHKGAVKPAKPWLQAPTQIRTRAGEAHANRMSIPLRARGQSTACNLLARHDETRKYYANYKNQEVHKEKSNCAGTLGATPTMHRPNRQSKRDKIRVRLLRINDFLREEQGEALSEPVAAQSFLLGTNFAIQGWHNASSALGRFSMSNSSSDLQKSLASSRFSHERPNRTLNLASLSWISCIFGEPT